MKQPIRHGAAFCLSLLLVASVCADSAGRPVAKVVDFTVIGPDAHLGTNVDLNNASISSVVNARQLVSYFFSKANITIPNNGFSCIIHVVKWASQVDSSKLVVAKSNWYVYNPQSSWTDSDFKSNKRIFGVAHPYLLAIHLEVPVAPLVDTTTGAVNYGFAYTYRTTHRLPANVQDLKDAIDLFNTGASRVRAAAPLSYWALGSLEGDPPSDINITGAVSNDANTINLDTAEVKFDDEGLYRWDISIGAPITSYKQLQNVVNTSGQQAPADVDKRNLLVLANVFIKPVDVKGSTFLTVPHLVGGVSIASKPLHSAMAGLGWGPAITNFYLGVMILTDNLPNKTLSHHYKLAFGVNVPLRTMASKLGLKSQVE